MRKKRSNKTDTKQTKPIAKTTDTIEEQVANLSHKFMTAFSAVAMVSAFLFLIFFFTSGVSDNIISSRTAPVTAAEREPLDGSDTQIIDDTSVTQSINGEDNPSSADNIGETNLKNEQHGSESVSESEMFITIVEEPSIDVMIRETLMDGGEVSKKDIIDRLETMDSSEFTALIGMLLANNPTEQATLPNESFHTSLEDAYEEAERLYPGQIDGSKRLRLIQDINAIDYLYYVAEDGDSLLELSRIFSVSLGQLVELNGIADADIIRAGEILLFPIDTAQPDINE